MSSLNFVSASDSNYTFSGDGSSGSPLNGYRYSYDGNSQTINYIAVASGVLYYNFTLNDMMSSGAMGYITINGSYVGSAVLSTPSSNLTGSTAINSSDVVQIYFNPGSSGGMANLYLESLYLAATSPTPTPTPTPSPTTANIIRPKRSSTASAVPSSLQPYELAVNIPDKKIWVADSSGTPVLMSELNDLPPSIDGGSF